MATYLPFLLAVPTLGAIVGSFMPNARAARSWALAVSIITLLCGALLAANFSFARSGEMQFVFSAINASSALSIPSIGFNFTLGIDSISLWLILLTVFLMPLAIAASFQSIKSREKEYYAWMLALLAAMLGVFVARDLLLFYIFFELTLIPMFFIIGIWGGPDRRFAAGKFFIFTFAGSIFTLAAIIYLGTKVGSFDIPTVVLHAQSSLISPQARVWVVLGLIIGFAVKVPLFPVHTWLPLAHTEAPTAGSVILAGVLLKLGTYGLLRLVVPVGLVGGNLDAIAYEGYFLRFFHYTVSLNGILQFLGVLCVIGIIYGALAAWVQKDIKKLVAYSSVSHLGFCVLGLLALNQYGMQGSVLYMVNHGLSTGALFLVIGMIYDRYHTRDIDQLSGLARIMPKMAFFFVLFAFSSIGLPGLNGFASEFLTVLGAFTSDRLGMGFGAFAAIGVILGAIYMLHMTARVIWGPLKTPTADHGAHGHDEHAHDAPAHSDLSGRELGILTPIAIAIVLLGIFPYTGMLKSLEAPLESLSTPMNKTHASQSPAQPTQSAAVVLEAKEH